LKTRDGGDLKLASLKENKATVLALFSATCPISNKLAPELARIEKDYASKQVRVLLVNTATGNNAEEVEKFLADHQLKSVVLSDPGQSLQRSLGASTTTEVFVLDAARTLVYRGAINDQYGLGYSKDAPKKHYLRGALDAVLRDGTPEISATSAPGCALDLAKADAIAANSGLTYHKDISRILQSNCVACHHKDGLGPFSLESYADVIEHAGMIKKQVDRGAMPPWFAAKQEGRAHEWANDRSLSARDKTELLAWLNSDRAEGSVADAPLPRRYEEQWMIGKPDAVFQIPRPVQVKAEGFMPYQTQTVETSFPEDRWVSAYEVMPTARAVVHHVIVRIHGKDAKIADREEGRDGFFAAYVPGNSYRVLPDGFAKRLPAGSRMSFQIHYTPNGKAAEDQVKIGLHFAKQAPQYEVHVAALSNPRLNIPAGQANHVETALQVIPGNMMLTAYMAHMHVRGKAFKYELIAADGKTETLLDIPRYDFNWQLQYDLAQPKFIPAGSTIKVTAVFDNSSGNPANPDPNKNVRWGPQTFDEMMIGYVEHFTPLPTSKVAAQ
jgi:thiol-disulfide isomerase/thioredoxin